MKKYSRFTISVFPLILLFLLANLSTAQALDKHPIDKEMDAAINKNPSTAGQNQAMTTALEKWDALLNRSYQKLKINLDPVALENLVESQRAWVVWRDMEIVFIGEFYSKLQGTMYIPGQIYKRMNLTRQRAMQLERLAGTVRDRVL